MIELGETTKEHYLLAAVATGNEEAAWKSLDELELLLKTAGGETDSRFVQNLPCPDTATYVGSGKAHELKAALEACGSDGVLCDDELTPTQMRCLSDILCCKVIDRTMLILDIFASHARTREGKVQVEMAQLKYRLSHLRGIGKAMSRLGGGIGTRGPGETKLETDRRAINHRISVLSQEIRSMKQVRETTRKKRTMGLYLTAAIVGYTNAGKSTLLNQITKADVPAEDKLFATLDPTTRLCELPDGEGILLTDTVGFINKLPHQLIDAFRSTLEESKYADIIIHVVDLADENAEAHMEVVYRTLSELGITGKPIITLFNKTDIISGEPGTDTPGDIPLDRRLRDPHADSTVYISARTGQGMDRLYTRLEEIIHESRSYVDTLIPWQDGGKLDLIRRYGHLLSEEYEPDGVHITAYVPKELFLQAGNTFKGRTD